MNSNSHHTLNSKYPPLFQTKDSFFREVFSSLKKLYFLCLSQILSWSNLVLLWFGLASFSNNTFISSLCDYGLQFLSCSKFSFIRLFDSCSFDISWALFFGWVFVFCWVFWVQSFFAVFFLLSLFLLFLFDWSSL